MAKARHYTDWHKIFPHSGKGKEFPWLLNTIERLETVKMLDYGCGKGGTADYIERECQHRVRISRYDTGYEQYQELPVDSAGEQFELVYTTDVLEHIEREDLPQVIGKIQGLTTNFHAHIIDLDPARKRLPDGRNAHVTLLTETEWIGEFDTAGSECVYSRVEYYKDKYLNPGRRRLHLLCMTRGTHA